MDFPDIQVITGEFSGRNVARIQRLGWGRCFIDRLRAHKAARPWSPMEPWILDNGAWVARNDPNGLDTWGWFLRVSEICGEMQEAPLFAVLPDIVGGGLDSLELSKWYLSSDRLGDEGELEASWNWYLAVQDGMSLADVEELLRDQQELDAIPTRYQVKVSGLFLGGSDTFKLETGKQWAELARKYGLGCHFGRCSSVRKLTAAIDHGYTSCDSTQMLWTKADFTRFAKAWLELTGRADPDLMDWVLDGAPVRGESLAADMKVSAVLSQPSEKVGA